MPFQAYYQGAYQTGRIGTEEFTALGLGKPAPRLPVPLVDRVSGPFAGSKADGVMGWGLGTNNKPTMLRKLMTKLDQPVITIFMSRLVYFLVFSKFEFLPLKCFSYKFIPSKGGITDQGQATYGGDDLKHCQRNYQRLPVIASDKWQVMAQRLGLFIYFVLSYSNQFSVNFGGQQFRGGKVLIQPGVRHLYGPPSAIIPMLRQIDSTYDFTLREYIVNCATVNQLPVLTIYFNQGTFTQILPRDYTVNVSFMIFEVLY